MSSGTHPDSLYGYLRTFPKRGDHPCRRRSGSTRRHPVERMLTAVGPAKHTGFCRCRRLLFIAPSSVKYRTYSRGFRRCSFVRRAEARFLRTLHTYLQVLSGKLTSPLSRRRNRARPELKNFERPAFGRQSVAGDSSMPPAMVSDRSVRMPGSKTLKQKLALSDEVRRYRSMNREVPGPSDREFLRRLTGLFVSIQPCNGRPTPLEATTRSWFGHARNRSKRFSVFRGEVWPARLALPHLATGLK